MVEAVLPQWYLKHFEIYLKTLINREIFDFIYVQMYHIQQLFELAFVFYTYTVILYINQ